jgi:outer membrane protein assembly factor BamB
MFAARSPRRPLALAAFLAVPLLALGSFTTAVSAQDVDRDADLAARRAELDARYAFGPTAARSLGYRIAWQTTIGGPVTRFDVFAGDVYALEAGNRLTRVDRATGSQIWTITACDPNDKVWGVTPGLPPFNALPWGENDGDRLYVTTDPVVFEIDHATGAVVGRQDLEKIPSTDVTRFGSYLIFGTRGGQIVWHQYLVGQEWRANQLLGPIVATPTMVGTDSIAAASQGGNVFLLDAKSAGRQWGDKVFDGVTAPLAAGGGQVFVAGRDQYLWAFNARNGRVAWKYFTESPLDTQPIHAVVTADGTSRGVVMQWVETEGLVGLEADPGDTIEGKMLWRIPDARGEGLGRIGENVVLWDADARILREIDPAAGTLVRSIDLPQVKTLRMVGDTIYACGDDGRLMRLDPVR